MTVADMLQIAALAAFVLAWWIRRTPRRPLILLATALAALAASAWGVLDDRWQAAVGVLAALVALAVLGVNRLRKADRREGVPYISGLLFGLLAAAAILPLVMFPVFPLPKPSGPHPVGVRDFEVDDPSRPGVFAAKPGEPRRLLVRVWYPAGEVKGLKRRPYFTAAETRTTARSLGELVDFPPYATFLKHVRTSAYEDAPLLAGAKGLPVVFYSHGYTSFLGQNTVLMEHLASHGYVVFSVQHTYDSTATVFPDGTVAPVDPGLRASSAGETEDAAKARLAAIAGANLDERLEGRLAQRETAQRTQPRLLRSSAVWTRDRLFLHDWLEHGAAPPAIREIAAAGNLSRVGEMGMSFGGAIAGTVCLVDRRCAAGVNLDGGDSPFQAFATQVPAPFLMFHSDLASFYREAGVKPPPRAPHSYNEFSYEAFGGTGTQPPVYRVMLRDTRHLGLSDFALFMRRPLRDAILGAAPAKAMIGAQNDFVLGFFDQHLRGQPGDFPTPQLAAYAGWVKPLPDSGVRAWWAAKPEAERAAIMARIARAKAQAPAQR